MLSKHGTLESAILSTLWKMEKEGIYTNSVKDVYNFLSQNDDEKRAYTTIKTVMDRLFEKNILLRFKQGRKFYYRTAYSNQDVLVNSLNEIANGYCQGDLSRLSNVLKTMMDSKLVNV